MGVQKESVVTYNTTLRKPKCVRMCVSNDTGQPLSVCLLALPLFPMNLPVIHGQKAPLVALPSVHWSGERLTACFLYIETKTCWCVCVHTQMHLSVLI